MDVQALSIFVASIVLCYTAKYRTEHDHVLLACWNL
jgi:hypothetical protein